MGRAIYWMRNDLRLSNNPLLNQAIAENEALVCVYIHDPRQFARTVISIPRIGWHRRRFLYQTLQQLRNDLRRVQIGLIELWGEPQLVLSQLAEELKVDAVYFSRECAPEERSVESFACSRLSLLKIRVVTAWTGFLLSPEQLPFAIADTPDVFSDFRRQLDKIGLRNLVASVTDLARSNNEKKTWLPKLDLL